MLRYSSHSFVGSYPEPDGVNFRFRFSLPNISLNEAQRFSIASAKQKD